MSEFLIILLSLSFSGTVLMLLLFLCKQLYRNAFSRRWQYYIWLLVILRFLLPFTPELTLSGYLFETAEHYLAADSVNPITSEAPTDAGTPFANSEKKPPFRQPQGTDTVFPANTQMSEAIPSADAQSSEAMLPTDAQSSEAMLSTDAQSSEAMLPTDAQSSEAMLPTDAGSFVFTVISTGGFLVWILTAIVLFARRIIAYRSFLCRLKPQNTEVIEPEILNRLADCEEHLHLKKPMELYRNPLIASPLMTGFFHPSIILPVRELPPESLQFIFTHELIHYKRHDMFYKWLIQLALCVHWFNPFVRLLEKETNKACELSCDEAVIEALGAEAKKPYGDMLLSFLRTGYSDKSPLVSLTLTEGTAELKERLGAIMDYRKKKKLIRTAAVLLTFVFCLCFMALGAYAAPSDSRDGIKASPTQIIANKDIAPDEQPENNIFYYVQQSPGNSLSFREEPVNAMYYYVQKGYYYDNYIFTMGWNLDERAGRPYFGPVQIRLADNSVIDAYFTDEVQAYSQDPAAIAAISGLISHLREQNAHPTLTMPLISRVTYVAPEDIPAMAEHFYSTEDLNGFTALFSALDADTQKEYYQRIYDDDRNNVLYGVVKYMDVDTRNSYLEKAYQDYEVALFAVLIDDIDTDTRGSYLEKAYQDYKVALFAVLADDIDTDTRNSYLERAYQDDETAFFTILADDIDTDTRDSYLEKAYQDDETTFFTILADNLTKEQRNLWIARTREERANIFYFVLTGEFLLP